MKASWKGSLHFGLVTINVELHTAVQQHALGFTLLHEKCGTPVSYHRWCAKCKKEIPWQNIEKGIELEDGTYFVVTKENLKKLKPEKTDSIAIVEFVEGSAIDPVLYDQHYYVVPGKTHHHAFFLFVTALEKLNKVAIGRFVLRDKEYVCALRSYNSALLLTTLNYRYEIRPLPLPKETKAPKITAKDLELAQQLIKTLTKRKFDIDQFKDTFVDNLKKQIQSAKKGKGKKVERKPIKPKVEERSLTKVLEASLKGKRSEREAARA